MSKSRQNGPFLSLDAFSGLASVFSFSLLLKSGGFFSTWQAIFLSSLFCAWVGVASPDCLDFRKYTDSITGITGKMLTQKILKGVRSSVKPSNGGRNYTNPVRPANTSRPAQMYVIEALPILAHLPERTTPLKTSN